MDCFTEGDDQVSTDSRIRSIIGWGESGYCGGFVIGGSSSGEVPNCGIANSCEVVTRNVCHDTCCDFDIVVGFDSQVSCGVDGEGCSINRGIAYRNGFHHRAICSVDGDISGTGLDGFVKGNGQVSTDRDCRSIIGWGEGICCGGFVIGPLDCYQFKLDKVYPRTVSCISSPVNCNYITICNSNVLKNFRALLIVVIVKVDGSNRSSTNLKVDDSVACIVIVANRHFILTVGTNLVISKGLRCRRCILTIVISSVSVKDTNESLSIDITCLINVVTLTNVIKVTNNTINFKDITGINNRVHFRNLLLLIRLG